MTDRLDNCANYVCFLIVLNGRRFARCAIDNQSIIAHVNQINGKLRQGLVVNFVIGSEGRDHCSQNRSERLTRCLICHD
jgi:hypothetical protein